MQKLLAAVTVLAVSTARADTIYVDDDAPLGGDGTSWDTAYRFLQDALADAAASAGSVTEIRVAQGVYKPDLDEAGNVTPGDREATFDLVCGISHNGGYVGIGASDPDDCDPAEYETVLSGDLLGDDDNTYTSRAENSYHVVTADTVTASTHLTGFTVTAGNATGLNGGGLAILKGSELTVSRCTFNRNRAFLGAGVYNAGELIITDCLFSANDNANLGGGIGNAGSLTMFSCIVRGNSALVGAGLANVFGLGEALVVNCEFSEGNGRLCGGVFNWGSSPVLINCTFSGNTYNHHPGPGALLSADYEGIASEPLLYNCIIWHNEDPAIGDFDASKTTMHHCNVQGGWAGAGSNNIDADPLFVSEVPSTCCGRGSGSVCDDADCRAAVCAVEPLCCAGGWQVFCADLAVELCAVCPNDYRLHAGSPCIDAGDNTAVPKGTTTDLDGNPRFVDDPYTPDTGFGDPPIVDMGAYEFQGASPCPWGCGDGDGNVGIVDFLALLAQWGGPGSCDFDGGGVGINDFLELLANWGPCP